MEGDRVNIIRREEWGAYAVGLRSDGIVQVEVGSEQDVQKENVEEIIEAVKKVGGGNKYPILILAGEYSLPTEEARLFIASPGNPYALAEAYVTPSLPQKLVGNFYLKFNKPGRPTRMFTSAADAVKWLRSFM